MGNPLGSAALLVEELVIVDGLQWAKNERFCEKDRQFLYP